MQTLNPPHEFKVMRIRECVAPFIADTPEKACEYWRANIPHSDWYDESKEAFVVLVLNARKRIIGHNLITLGLLDECHAHSREVFRAAIVSAGKEIILIHNHPSADTTPSEADIKVTRELIRAGQMLGIPVLDHIIVGTIGSLNDKGYSSLKELGFFFD